MRGSGKDAGEYGKEALQHGKQGGNLSNPRASGNGTLFLDEAGARAEERAFACRIRDWGPLRIWVEVLNPIDFKK